MSRTINQKQQASQRSRIIDVTQKILVEKNYEDTSINDVIRRSGIAKGTFYHYFDSKETLFDQLINKLTAGVLAHIRKVIDDPALSAVEKFNRMIDVSAKYKIANRHIYWAITRWIYRDSNIRLRHKIFRQAEINIVPLFESIIIQGVKERSFKVSYPRETAEIIMRLMVGYGEAMGPVLAKVDLNKFKKQMFIDQIAAFNEAIERLLGVIPGQLKVFDRKVVDRFFDI